MKHTTIRNLPVSERPYEKANMYGVSVLSDAELLAVILRTGTKEKTSIDLAREVLTASKTHPGLLGLMHLNRHELTRIEGIGPVKALELLCVGELSRRISGQVRIPGKTIRKPEDVALFLMEEMRSYETEHLVVAFFDAAGRMFKHENVFKGTIDTATVSTREVLRLALSYDAAGIMILHNHPSGDPTPSEADINTTDTFYRACSLMNVRFLDHIIIGDNTYVSFNEAGLIPNSDKQ